MSDQVVTGERPALPQPLPRQENDGREAARMGREGVFISRNALLNITIIIAAVTAAILVAVNPAVGIPVGVGVAVAGLLHTIFGPWRGNGSFH